MNAVSILIVALIAIAFAAAFRYTRKNGSCEACGSGKKGCASCNMAPFEHQQEQEYLKKWQAEHPEAAQKWNEIRKS